MLGSFLAHLLSVPVAFWSPPGWNQYVDLIEHALDFLASTFHSAGLAVIVFTILVKTVLVPLTVQSLRSSRAMQELQPQVKELQKKYGKDRQRLSQETMALYSRHRINPMAGCLPMLIQIPIFFGLYRAIVELSNSNTQYWGDNFLWIRSLDAADPYKILPIMAGVFQFVQTKMMRPANQGKISDPQQAMMNTMMNFMPLMVIAFGWTFAAGPVIYWATQSVFSVVQQWFITGWGSMKDWFPNLPDLPEHRRLGYRPPRAVEDVVVVSGEGAAVRQSGFMGWMQRKMEQQQEQAAARRQRLAGGTSAAKSTSALQEKVDAEVRTTTRPSKRSAARSGNRRRTRPTVNNGAAAKASAAATDAAAQTTDQVDQANGVARPPVVPRKSRPARKQPNREIGDG